MTTTVYIQQQQQQVASQVQVWSTGICDCCQDMSSSCYALWCCPCFACSTAGEFGESTCLPIVDMFGPALMVALEMPVCMPPVTLGMRVAIRYKYGITGTICEDIMASLFCFWCTWCQMGREIKERKKNITMITTVQPMAVGMPVTTTTQMYSSQQSFKVVTNPQSPVMTAPPPGMTTPLPAPGDLNKQVAIV